MEIKRHKIAAVKPESPAGRAGVRAGEYLVGIGGRPVGDVLDFLFLSSERSLVLALSDESGRERRLKVDNSAYEPLGITFERYLMDKERRCANKCIFCFVDQLPPGLRDSLYFKDDDARLSLLAGNYITLTNLSEQDIDRLVSLRLSPVNISVHTMNPELRVRMTGNPRAAELTGILRRFYESGMQVRCQIVLCPGINDGAELRYTMDELKKLWPSVTSVSVVPVGLTRHREGLYPLRPFDAALAARTLDEVASMSRECLHKLGTRLFYPADELYILAGRPLPGVGFYEGMEQLENGVGMLPLFMRQAKDAIRRAHSPAGLFESAVATGEAAAPFLSLLVDRLTGKCHNIRCEVIAVKNEFFGGGVNVAGLVTGADLIRALSKRKLLRRVYIPSSMLRSEGDLFLDGLSPAQVSEAVGRPVIPVAPKGGAFVRALCGRYSDASGSL